MVSASRPTPAPAPELGQVPDTPPIPRLPWRSGGLGRDPPRI